MAHEVGRTAEKGKCGLITQVQKYIIFNLCYYQVTTKGVELSSVQCNLNCDTEIYCDSQDFISKANFCT